MVETPVYLDDRMFLLHIARCTVARVDEDIIEIVIYHDNVPSNWLWCIVTYRNVARFPVVRVDHFPSFEEATAYRQLVEPQVPLVSLSGQSPAVPLPYRQFVVWKARRGMKDYDVTDAHGAAARNRCEIVLSYSRA